MVSEKHAVSTLPAHRSIRSLYSLALAEGEGLGTTNEYFAKRIPLAPWSALLPHPRRLLIAGLPEKFGYSLDLLLLAEELAIPDVVVITIARSAVEGIRRSLAAAQAGGELMRLQPRYLVVTDLAQSEELTDHFRSLSCVEVLQRLDTTGRRRYVERLARIAPAFVLFAPNATTPVIRTLGGFSGLTLH